MVCFILRTVQTSTSIQLNIMLNKENEQIVTFKRHETRKYLAFFA